MEILLSFAPVIVLLACMHILDSYKLISIKQILLAILFGGLAALFAFAINNIAYTKLDFGIMYSSIFVPFFEEGLKYLFIYWLFSNNRIGFSVDGAIYGFAVGSGFAIAENLYYYIYLFDLDITVSAVRGLGTAIMHGSTTSLAAIITVFFYYKAERHSELTYLLPGYILAVTIHMLYNQFFMTPIVSAIVTFTFFPITFIIIFYLNDRSIRGWMDLELDSEATLLSAIKAGQFSGTNAGNYFMKVKDRFSPEIIVDMICYLQLYLELSIRAKGMMMMREAGIEQEVDPDTKANIREFNELRKRIGKLGILALRPIVNISDKSLWKINMLDK